MLYAINPKDAAELPDEEDPFYEALEAVPLYDLGTTWHGLHYLLTLTEHGFSALAKFLLEGGEEIEGTNSGYGPARIFSPREVDDIHSVVGEITEDELWSHFDADQMEAEQIYPLNWHDEPLITRRVYLTTFRELQKFIDAASRVGNSLIVTLV